MICERSVCYRFPVCNRCNGQGPAVCIIEGAPKLERGAWAGLFGGDESSLPDKDGNWMCHLCLKQLGLKVGFSWKAGGQ